MNIVVIGSCTDSSILAKELNKRLSDSIVARVDLLKNIKQLVLQDMNVTTLENIGTYVGDVETYDIGKLSAAQHQQVTTTLQTVEANISTLKKGYVASPAHLSTFDALTNSLPTGTYSFIKVYSGAIDDIRINSLLRNSGFISSAIVIVIKSPKDLLLPINVSERVLDSIKKNAFAFVDCDEAKDVMNSEVFQLLFDLTSDKNKPKVEEPIESSSPMTVQHGALIGGMPAQEIVLEEPWLAQAA
jgi:hypothetical protein